MDNSIFEIILQTIKELVYALSGYIDTNLSSNILLTEMTFFNVTITLQDLLVQGLTITAITFAIIFVFKIFSYGIRFLRGFL